MAHEDVSYYRGQYKDRLLRLLRSGAPPASPRASAFTDRMESLAEQWRDLHARRAQLKAHVVTSGATVKENERLRSQALKKAKEEKEENSKKESELLRARRELEALRKQHQVLSKKLLKYSLFKKYLDEVVENSQFHDIDDIITYYKALLRTRKDLLQSQWWHRQLMEQAVAGRGPCPQEDRWAQVQDRAARKAVELRSLTMAIHSLFQAASARLQPQGRVAAGDSHRQLDMIRQFIHDLQDFTEDMKERGRAL
ncbi:coiled-coil domain-containing protein 42 [Onychostruthus taczanowskii]|uniref:coiled-coil domain-containing protein 42 n=1 Tax=Onychostruthus taczanowskii TaxID=356909 RepID=UPI001B804F56|nr:coiled-coil domain-containing protein 42 [Onychostruthus taczanowskii]